MATVIPFKGLLFNPQKIEHIEDVVSPPYDVISEKERRELHQRHPNNIVRLILGEKTENDTPDNNPHTRSAKFYNEWIAAGILLQDETPALYVTSVEFMIDKTTVTRYGLIAAVKLEPFEKGIILPHEKTFSKVKSERLELMKKAHANYSPIFSLYPDNGDVLGTLVRAIRTKPPEMDIADTKDHIHKLWRITDPEIIRYVTEAMYNKQIFIADGHHRYETALNYRDWVSGQTPDFNSDHPANYIMMYLSSLNDPGLIIRPAHRILKTISGITTTLLLAKISDYFSIETIPFNTASSDSDIASFTALLRQKSNNQVIGMYLKEHAHFHLLTLLPGVMESLFGDELQQSLRALDVTVLTRLILMKIIGLDQTQLDDEHLMSYSSSEKEAVQAVASGENDIVFLLNPTKIQQVQTIAEEGLIMPRKATYFYPKAITGQVLNKLTAD